MAAFTGGNIDERFDRAQAIIKQRNLCLICHLPLCYGSFHDGANIQYDTLDYKWYVVQYYWKTMKLRNDPNHPNIWNTNAYGTDYTQCNAERCHLINSSLILEIEKSDIFVTPSLGTQHMRPDLSLWVGVVTPPRFQWKMTRAQLDIFTWSYDSARVSRLSDMFTCSGVNYFMACKDCNSKHTGDASLRHIYEDYYMVRHHARRNVLDAQKVYTIMFNLFSENDENIILLDGARIRNWHFECWFNYSILMFLCQQQRSVEVIDNRQEYFFFNAHRDIGLADFYMGQIIASILYYNFDIPCSFPFLYQTCLSMWANWAVRQNYNEGNETKSLWRWVFGTPVDNTVMCNYVVVDDQEIWTNTAEQAIINKLLIFTERWIKPLGHVLSGGQCPQGYNAQRWAQLVEFVAQETNSTFIKAGKLVVTSLFNVNETQHTLVEFFMNDPMLHDFQAAMEVVWDYLQQHDLIIGARGPLVWKKVMWENFMLSFRRSELWKRKLVNNVLLPDVNDRHTLAQHWNNFVNAVGQLTA